MEVTVAIVGAGFMGETHASSYAKIEGARVKYICDIDPGKGNPLARSAGADYVPDFDVLLGREVDIVDICLPTALHRPFAVRALEEGFNLFLEKPLAIDMEEGSAICDASAGASGLSMVGHVLRFWPGFTELRDRVAAGELGEPRHLLAYRVGPPPAWANWYMDMKKSNGVILDLGIHDLDFARWVMGMPRSVFAQVHEKNGVHAHGQVLLDYGRGEALVECSWMGSPNFPFTTYMEVAGTGGLATVDGRASNAFSIFSGDNSVSGDPFHEDGYVRELRHFVDCVRDGEGPSVPMPEGLETIRLSLSAVESAGAGGPVRTG